MKMQISEYFKGFMLFCFSCINKETSTGHYKVDYLYSSSIHLHPDWISISDPLMFTAF